MIGYRVRRFLAAWREQSRRVRAFLAWNAANTLAAFALLLSSFFLLAVLGRPGFQRTVLFGYIVVAVVWLVSVFAIGPAYERLVPPEKRGR
ncbi:hypothetical protein BRC95_02385 [Halobacteriales archaeon QS_5_68_33]|nr:MAG: hypothetical protein BRC95_02385 [Halobacteriales archaeon QS_5_68_33]